jgi:hypothetical protein
LSRVPPRTERNEKMMTPAFLKVQKPASPRKGRSFMRLNAGIAALSFIFTVVAIEGMPIVATLAVLREES